jgi:dTDP-4-amino-4,6-dideoxygalactose transaminase
MDASTNRELPHYYFEDIALIQIESIVKYMMRLENLLARRRACANLLLKTLQQMTIPDRGLVPAPLSRQGKDPSYWQFLMCVTDMKTAQNLLFRAGIETGITNLPNLADYQNVPLTNARALKSEFIFLPLHFHLKSRDYRRMLSHLSVDKKSRRINA